MSVAGTVRELKARGLQLERRGVKQSVKNAFAKVGKWFKENAAPILGKVVSMVAKV